MRARLAGLMIFGGDLAQLGKNRGNLSSAMSSSKEIKRIRRFIQGEPRLVFWTWESKWGELFGQPTWTVRSQGCALVWLVTRSVAAKDLMFLDGEGVKRVRRERKWGHMADPRRQE